MTLEEEKQKLVAMRDELRQKVDKYDLDKIGGDGGKFKSMANTLYNIEQKLESINKKLLSNN